MIVPNVQPVAVAAVSSPVAITSVRAEVVKVAVPVQPLPQLLIDALADGVKLPGVTAEKDLTIDVRGKATRTIDI